MELADWGTPDKAKPVRNAPVQREGMYHRGVEEGGRVAAEETQRGETVEPFVRQEAAESRFLCLGRVVERTEICEIRTMAINEERRWGKKRIWKVNNEIMNNNGDKVKKEVINQSVTDEICTFALDQL